jgi:hypothetical protein
MLAVNPIPFAFLFICFPFPESVTSLFGREKTFARNWRRKIAPPPLVLVSSTRVHQNLATTHENRIQNWEKLESVRQKKNKERKLQIKT